MRSLARGAGGADLRYAGQARALGAGSMFHASRSGRSDRAARANAAAAWHQAKARRDRTRAAWSNLAIRSASYCQGSWNRMRVRRAGVPAPLRYN